MTLNYPRPGTTIKRSHLASPHRHHHNTNINKPAAISTFSALHHIYGIFSAFISRENTCVCQPTASQTNTTWARQSVFYTSLAKAFSMREDRSCKRFYHHFALVMANDERAQSRQHIPHATPFASGRGNLVFCYRNHHRTKSGHLSFYHFQLYQPKFSTVADRGLSVAVWQDGRRDLGGQLSRE